MNGRGTPAPRSTGHERPHERRPSDWQRTRGLGAFYLELLREAHEAAIEDGAVLSGGKALGLGGVIEGKPFEKSPFRDVALVGPVESKQLDLLADAALAKAGVGITRLELVDLLISQFGVSRMELAYAWDIPTYPVMFEGVLQPEGAPEFYILNPLDPDNQPYFGGPYRPDETYINRQGREMTGQYREQQGGEWSVRPMEVPEYYPELSRRDQGGRAGAYRGDHPLNPNAQFRQQPFSNAFLRSGGHAYEQIYDVVANTPTDWALEFAFGALFGPTGRTIGGKAFRYLGKTLADIPPALLTRFRNMIKNLGKGDTPDLTVLPGGGQGGPPPAGRRGGGPYDVAGETGPPPGVAGGAEFPIPPDRVPDLELPDADVIPFPTDRFGPADDIPLADTLDQLSGAERFRAMQAKGRARAREWWDTLSDEGKATAQEAWERHGETGQVFDPTNDYDVRNAYVIHKRGDMTPAEQWNALGDPRPQATDALYEGMTLKDIGELQGVAASEVTPAHIAEAVDAGVLSEADGARLLDPFPRTPEVPGQMSLWEAVEAKRYKHFTTPERRQGLIDSGGEWDPSRPPVHGMQRGAGTRAAGDYLYLSLDDPRWGVAHPETGEGYVLPSRDYPGIPQPDTDPDSVKRFYGSDINDRGDGAFGAGEKTWDYEAIEEEYRRLDDMEYDDNRPSQRTFYDYDGQVWRNEVGGETTQELSAVDFTIDPEARVLVIDSPESYRAALAEARSLGGEGVWLAEVRDPAQDGWKVLEQKYDIVEIRNVDDLIEGEHRKFFRTFGSDQIIVLNPDVARLSDVQMAGPPGVVPETEVEKWHRLGEDAPLPEEPPDPFPQEAAPYWEDPALVGYEPPDPPGVEGPSFTPTRFGGDIRMEPTIPIGGGAAGEGPIVRISSHIIYHRGGNTGTVRPMIIVDMGDGRLQPFYQRSGRGSKATPGEVERIVAGGGGGAGQWVPMDGVGISVDPHHIRKDRFTAMGPDLPLFRYGTDELKAVGEVLDESPYLAEVSMIADSGDLRGPGIIEVDTRDLVDGTEVTTTEALNEMLGVVDIEAYGDSGAGLWYDNQMHVMLESDRWNAAGQTYGLGWEDYLPPAERMTDDELRAGLQWKIDGPPSTSKMAGGKVAAGMVAGPVALVAAEAAFPTQVKQVMTGLADRADSWWSWIKDYPDHLEWMTRSVGSTLDGLEKGSRSTGNQTVDLLSDGFRDQSNALLTSLGGGAVPVIGREDADLVRGTSKHLSQQGHNGQAMFSNDVRRQMEAGDAMVVGYRSEQDYQRALEQAGRYGLEIDRHFWRKPSRKNIRPARGQEWTRDDLKKLATTNHFYPDAGLRQGPR